MPALPVQKLNDHLSVAAQLNPSDMALAASMGFRSVVNNRPDFEHDLHQPTSADVGAAAQAAGLEYRFLPVSGAYQSPEEIAAFAQLMSELPKPVLAYCRSGARSTKLALAALG